MVYFFSSRCLFFAQRTRNVGQFGLFCCKCTHFLVHLLQALIVRRCYCNIVILAMFNWWYLGPVSSQTKFQGQTNFASVDWIILAHKGMWRVSIIDQYSQTNLDQVKLSFISSVKDHIQLKLVTLAYREPRTQGWSFFQEQTTSWTRTQTLEDHHLKI